MTIPIKPRSIQVICGACGVTYHLPWSNRKGRSVLILDFAVCPACKTPRFPQNLADYPEGRCVECNVPFKLTFKGVQAALDLCWPCYQAKRRRKEEEPRPLSEPGLADTLGAARPSSARGPVD